MAEHMSDYINFVGIIILPIMGFFFMALQRRLAGQDSRIDNITTAFEKLSVEIPRVYITRAEVEAKLQNIDGKLDRITDRLFYAGQLNNNRSNNERG